MLARTSSAVDTGVPMVQDGVTETGVSVAFTVRAMDAGPLLAQERVAVDDAIQAPELLGSLFTCGTELLIRHLPLVWDGRARQQALPQVSLLPASTLCTLREVMDTQPFLNGKFWSLQLNAFGAGTQHCMPDFTMPMVHPRIVRQVMTSCRMRQQCCTHPR